MKRLSCVLVGLFLGFSASAHEGSHENQSQKIVKVEITKDGFKPSKITAHKGDDLVLLVTRKTDNTCMKELKNTDGTNHIKLPLNTEVEFKLGKLTTFGEIKLLCGMDMTAGVVKVM